MSRPLLSTSTASYCTTTNDDDDDDDYLAFLAKVSLPVLENNFDFLVTRSPEKQLT